MRIQWDISEEGRPEVLARAEPDESSNKYHTRDSFNEHIHYAVISHQLDCKIVRGCQREEV